MDMIDRAYTKKLVNGLSSGYLSSSVTDNADGSKTLTINFVNGDKAEVTFSPVKGDKGDTGISVQGVKIQEINGIRHLIVTLDDGTELDAGVLPNEQYDDTQIKTDISNLQTDKQDVTDNNLDTTDKTVVGAINEIYGTQLDTVGFSADYKNIILNRKSGLNPYTIPISSIIHNAKLTELNDIDSTDIGNGKTLVYDSATQKHKYVDSTGTDELVKMEASTEAHYLSDLIDKSTIVNDNGTLKVKKLDGQNVTIAEINYLKGLTMNVMDLVNMFSNGGVKIINTPVNTYADLLTYDKTSLIDGISYLVYVLADETHDNAKTTYLIDKTSSTPTYFGFAGEHRDFTTNPIDLATEVTGKLGTSNIDVDALWKLLTINDTYKTLTTNDEVFGTHGAKALYDELLASIGGKANTKDLTKHTSDTDIHITTSERTKWDKTSTDFTTHTGNADIHTSATEKASYVKKTDITNTINSTSTNTQVPSAKSVYDNAIKCNNIKTYYTLAQLGITSATCTIKDIWDKMPVNSIAIIDTNSSIVTDLDYFKAKFNITDNQGVYGFLTIGKFIERTILEFRRSHSESAIIPETFIGYCIGKNCTAIQWKKVYITGVTDVGRTAITFTDETNYKNYDTNNAFSHYYVQNGICYMSIYITCVSPHTNTSIIKTCTSALPKPKYNVRKQVSAWEITNSNSNCIKFCINDTSAFIFGGTVGKSYLVQFSYPVAEN